jgi:magnesium transporter
MTAPKESEIKLIAEKYSIEPEAIQAALDADERSRIEVDDNFTMIIVNVPTVKVDSEKELYDTIPLSIILVKDAVITVCRQKTPILTGFIENKVKSFSPAMRSRFVIQILYRTASLFLQYLRMIDKKSDEVENKLHKATKNHELIELLKLEKSLVYFSTALRSNELVLEKLTRGNFIKKYEEDTELLEDAIIENKQAIEMANIYSGILSGMMGAFASVISNNMNIVMKVLAIITIVMSIPTMIFSAYGMNIVGMPLTQNSIGFVIIIAVSIIASVAAGIVLVKSKLFK